jgi:hypothetical protein
MKVRSAGLVCLLLLSLSSPMFGQPSRDDGPGKSIGDRIIRVVKRLLPTSIVRILDDYPAPPHG